MTKLTIQEGVREIEEDAFCSCPHLAYMVFPDDVIELDGMELVRYLKCDTPFDPVEHLQWNFV